MNSYLQIGKPFLKEVGDKVRLCSNLTEVLEGRTVRDYEMWFEVEKQFSNGLCFERIDAFIAANLFYCMEKGLNIKSDSPMSKKLFYQLTSEYIPTISKNTLKYNAVEIIAPTSDAKLESLNKVGTGVSGGVDSFYTILKHYKMDERYSGYELTDLTFFNVGSHGDNGGKIARELFYKRSIKAKKIADELELPIILVDSNISEFISQSFLATASVRNIAAILALQKYFCKYYFSSGEPVSFFNLDERENDNYDILNTVHFSTENVEIYNTGLSQTRIDKLEFISKYPVARKNLNICIAGEDNCGECDKCVRTMNALYALDALDLYDEVFDLKKYKDNLSERWSVTLERMSNDTYSQQNHLEAYNLMVKKGKAIPKDAFKYLNKRKTQKFFKKVKNKLKAIFRKQTKTS